MKFFTRNLSVHFKKFQSFQTKKNLQELVLAKISCIPHPFNLVGGLKLQYQ